MISLCTLTYLFSPQAYSVLFSPPIQSTSHWVNFQLSPPSPEKLYSTFLVPPCHISTKDKLYFSVLFSSFLRDNLAFTTYPSNYLSSSRPFLLQKTSSRPPPASMSVTVSSHEERWSFFRSENNNLSHFQLQQAQGTMWQVIIYPKEKFKCIQEVRLHLVYASWEVQGVILFCLAKRLKLGTPFYSKSIFIS